MDTKRKLLVTGGHGFVAGAILAQAESRWDVHAMSRGPGEPGGSGVTWHQVDPLAAAERDRVLDELQPQVIIHTAALADIDACQANPGLAQSVNVDLTRALSRWCEKRRARLVFCSTDTVFDGEHAPYREDSPPAPVNAYAETKVAAEKLVADLGPGAVIARLALVIGLPVLGRGNSLLARMVDSLRQGQELRMPIFEVRTPIDVLTVGEALLELAGGTFQGVFHLAGRSRVNRFAMARLIAQRLGFREELVVPTDSPATPGRAPRPRDVSLDSARARAELQTRMLTLDEGLARILAQAGGGRQSGLTFQPSSQTT